MGRDDLPDMYASTYILGKSQLSMLHMLYNTMATALLIQSYKELLHSSIGLIIQTSTTIYIYIYIYV